MASSDGFDPTGSHDIDFLLAVVDPYTHRQPPASRLESATAMHAVW